MNIHDLEQLVRDLLDTEDSEGCSDDLTVVGSAQIAALRSHLDSQGHVKRDDAGLYETHTKEPGTLGIGDMWVIRWSCHFETRVKLDTGATEQDARDAAGEIDVPEGTAIYVGETFDIVEIETEGDYKEKYGL